MNPENKPFFNHEEKKPENKAENKEKKERINLSFMLASDLIKQIKSGEKLNLNDYQRICEYAVIHNKTTGQNDIWYLEVDLFTDEDGFSTFLEELPACYEKASDLNMKIFFCGSQYDIPLNKTPEDYLMNNKEKLPNLATYLTPDGIKYEKEYIKMTDADGKEYKAPVVKYFDDEHLSLDEVKEQAKIVENKFGSDRLLRPFRYYHYGQSEIEDAH